MDALLFDTRYGEGRFFFESETFTQGNVVKALGWSERRGVSHLVRAVGQTGAVAVLRSRRSWATREEAERAMASFLDLVACRREDGPHSAELVF